jgi:Nuclear protein 96./Nucleoporin autopeptidase.
LERGFRQSPKQSQGSVIPTSIYQRDAKSVRYRGLAGGLSPPGTLNGTSPSVLSSYHAGPRSTAMIRPRGFKPATISLGSASRSTKSMLSPSPLLGSATKQLVIKSDALTPKPKTRLILSDDEISAKKTPDESETPRDLIKGRHIQNGDTPSNQSDRILPFEDSRIANEKSDFQSPEANGQHVSSTPESKIQMNSSKKTQSGGTPMDDAYDFYRSVIGTSPAAQNGESSAKQHNISLVPKLTREGYVMTPSAESLSKMSEADLAAVPNFVVERIGFGSVAWEGAVDVRGIDLDSVVSIESKAVEVYHKEEEKGAKPPVGTKLNRPAILTLHNVYPKSGAGASDAEKEQFERKIAKKTKEMGASLILYDPDIGVWKLHVEHFSRYALDDDSDDDDDTHSKDIHATQSSPRADFDSGVRGGRTQVSWENSSGTTRFHISDNEDECMHAIDENPLLSKDTKANGAEAAAEAAYAELCHLDQQMQQHGSFEEERDRYYHEVNEVSSYMVETHVFEPPSRPLSSVNICAQIAKKCGIKRPTSSAIDFGLRMGKSFGVCWRPDGSFLHPISTSQKDPFQSKKLVQSRPVVSNPLPPDHLKLLKVHLKHVSNINEGSNFPLFRFADDRMAMDACADLANEIGSKDVCNCEDTIDTSHVFSLVAILFSDTNKLKSFYSNRQKEAAFRVWLRNLCRVDPDSNVTEKNGSGDGYEAIFKALSGDDIIKASSLAQCAGHNMLALLIANSNSSSISLLSEQMRLWNSTGAINLFPPELIRIYSYLTRDLQIENTLHQSGSIIPWERRLMMLLRTIDGQSRSCSDSLLTLLINQYERDVKNGLAPPANTNWCKQTSTFFRIMKLFVETEVGGKNISLLKTISPFGHRINPFDVSISFHLSAILSSLEICEELSEDEEIALLESYAFQLQIIGAWEWAVYVCLCRLKISQLSQSIMDVKKSMAIEIIRKHYWSDNDSLMQEKRSFLEQEVGIPSQWFEDSLKLVAIMRFDIKSFLTHGLLASKQEALQVYEEAVLPDIVFSGDEDDMNDVYCVLNEVHNHSGDGTSFREVVFDFLKFRSQAFRFLTETNMAEFSSQQLLGAAQSVQHRLMCLQKNYPSSMMLFPGLPLVPRCIVLKEMMDSVSVMVGMIENVILGKHLELSHGVATTLDYSRSAFSPRNDDLMFHHLDPRSCLRGMFKLKDPDAEISSGPNYRPSSFL